MPALGYSAIIVSSVSELSGTSFLGVSLIFNGKKVSAVLLAAGASSRMNMNINKVYLLLNAYNTSALFYPLMALDKNEYIDEIVIVIRGGERELFESMVLRGKLLQKNVLFAAGGEWRSDSVYNGLLKATGDIVLVHDGARPLLKQRFISDCVEAMEEYAGAVVGVKCADTICSVDENNCLAQREEQARLYRVQTPQCFRKEILLECHEKIMEKRGITDDSALLELCGYRVRMLRGDESNIKLTVPTDIIIAEQCILNDDELLNLLAYQDLSSKIAENISNKSS